MDIKQILFLIRRWYWLLAVGLIVGLSSGLLVSFLMTPIFEAETKVLVSRNPQSLTAEFPNLNDNQLVQTYVELVLTDQIQDKASEVLDFKIDPDSLIVQQLRDTQIIQIAVQDTDAKRSAMIANLLVTVLQEENIRLQADKYLTSENSLEEQIVQAKEEMDRLQNEIDQILAQDVAEQLEEVDRQIAGVESEISALQAEITRMGTPLATEAQARLVDKQAQLALLQSLLSRYQNIRTNLLFLGKPYEAGSGFVNPRLEQIQSTFDLYEQIYLSNLNSLENLRLTRLQSTPTIVQIDTATVPAKPLRPIPIIYTGLAAVVGLMITVVAAVLLEYMDDTVKTPEDVQSIAGALTLGMIRKEPDLKEHLINIQDVSESPLAGIFEDYRSLGVQLEAQREMKPIKKLLITSSSKGEGKTTAAINLATIYARSGLQVILLDANPKQPYLHTVMGESSEVQVFDLVRSGQDRSIMNKDLLGGGKIDLFLDTIRDWEDSLIIIDAPPISHADAKMLVPNVDGIVLVVEAWKTKKGALRSTVHQLNQMHAKLIGVMLNSFPTEYCYYYDCHQFFKPDDRNEDQSSRQKNLITKWLQLISDRLLKGKVKEV